MVVKDHLAQADSLLAAAIQLAPVLGDLDGNRSRAREAIERAALAGARLIVLPELAVSGYAFTDSGEAMRLAESIPGPSTRDWQQLAAKHGLTIVGGLCERTGDGDLFNSAVVVDGDGLLAVHRKSHLWDREQEIFRPGEIAPPVLDTPFGRLGVAICYEAFFPELMRSLALAGAEIVAVPMASPLEGAPPTPLAIEVILAIAAAHVNRIFIVQADRAGTERGIEWAQASVIVGCDGALLAEPQRGEALLSATLAPANARDKRFGDRNHLFEDMRPGLYQAAQRASGLTLGARRQINGQATMEEQR